MLYEISFLRMHAIVPEGPIPHSNQTFNALISISSNIIIEPKLEICYSEQSINININVYPCAVNNRCIMGQNVLTFNIEHNLKAVFIYGNLKRMNKKLLYGKE